MAIRTIAILSPGDMGTGFGRDLGQRGHDVITCLVGRSDVTRSRAAKAGFREVAETRYAVGAGVQQDVLQAQISVARMTEDITIAELAELICRVVGYRGELRFDSSKPDGTPRKLLDVGRLTALGWQARIGLEEGLAATYRWYLEQAA